YTTESQDDVMYGFLTTGQRRLPRMNEAEGAIPGSVTHAQYLGSPVSIGTLPPGKSVIVKFAVTINNPTAATAISNQGTVSGGNFSNVLTDDPNVGGAADPTVTLVEQPPVVSNISPNTNEDTTLTFSAAIFNAGFADPNAGDTLQTVRITSLPTNGVLKNNGTTISVVPTDIAIANIGLLTYVPNADYNGPDSFGWNGSDGTLFALSGALVNITVNPVNGGTSPGVDTSAVQTFNINVTAVNDAPTLNTISDPAPININSGQQTVNLSGISEGPANESAQTVSVSAVSDNTGLIPNPTANYVDPATTGSLNYTPVAGQSGTAHITVTVQDSGDTLNGGANSVQRMFTVVVKPASTTTLVSSQNPSGNGVPVTFTATVTPNTATGSVQFFDGATPLVCSENGGNSLQPLVSAQATCTTSSLSVGGSPHPITAQYGGDANLSPSISNIIQQNVQN